VPQPSRDYEQRYEVTNTNRHLGREQPTDVRLKDQVLTPWLTSPVNVSARALYRSAAVSGVQFRSFAMEQDGEY
jgi:hypothetical protein